MTTIAGATNFVLEEFVPKQLIDMFGETAIQFIDARIIQLATFERNYYGKRVTINDYAFGGQLQERGFRMPDSKTGAPLSQHKFGRAFDRNIEGMTPQEHFQAILDNAAKYLEMGLTTLENIEFTNRWQHADCRNVAGYPRSDGASWKWINGILIVNP